MTDTKDDELSADAKAVGMAFFGYQAVGKVIDPTGKAAWTLTARARDGLLELQRAGRVTVAEGGWRVMVSFDGCVAWAKANQPLVAWTLRTRNNR